MYIPISWPTQSREASGSFAEELEVIKAVIKSGLLLVKSNWSRWSTKVLNLSWGYFN